MSMTVLLSRSGIMTKTIADGAVVRGYSAGMFYRVRHADVAGFADMVRVLDKASGIPAAGIIRGEPLPGINRENTRRLSNRAQHGDAVTFGPAARQWLGIDLDKVPEPAGLDFAQDPEAGVEHVIGLLPDEFADASCWWEATSGAGIKPGINVRLWYWLSRPIEDAECKGWLGPHGADTSIYQPVGIHYVAAPLILSGRDPMARRQGVRQGLDDVVVVPAELPRIETLDAAPIHVPLRPLDDRGARVLAYTLRQSRQALDIWTGRRTYQDRSTRHHAFLCAIMRAGILDDMDNIELMPGAMLALDEQLGADTGKAIRPDYQAITIGAALAAVTAEARS